MRKFCFKIVFQTLSSNSDDISVQTLVLPIFARSCVDASNRIYKLIEEIGRLSGGFVFVKSELL